ncbi:Transmembrane emp24 domain-containing protein 7 [Trichoplax sp. H2]|uniref:GOLD domain-containing protein n=1 Tax=Trichoplax adhaerens TaxID=10228 RepID=B3S7R9_TRIAD|nr:expressed hypothetical protein [Trichoplax adhaerens]EDV21244.1 expressed hypothetical protein [Trichoplax adhaerens]RDD47624.1 Transmembrane emp24 domain-containing protein 7 [Trichoplax sp. H2]|eukprot:XP_002116211.1 expressed hypothetical protein [Trichoplax adhaerens]
MLKNDRIWITSLLLLLVTCSWCVELTFELPDNSVECFYEDLTKNGKTTLEYQVLSGGNYDVDVVIKGPDSGQIYSGQRKQYDSHTFSAESDGVYSFCFSNEFSSFTHKVIYFDLVVGDEAPILDRLNKKQSALTQLESSCVNIHENLNVLIDVQTHHRNRESAGRNLAELLNERVSYWSVGESVIIVIIGIGQVWLLRRFFTTKKSTL